MPLRRKMSLVSISISGAKIFIEPTMKIQSIRESEVSWRTWLPIYHVEGGLREGDIVRASTVGKILMKRMLS